VSELFEQTPYFAVCFFILGSMFGSFANVVIYRLPRGESVVLPGSHCMECGHKVRFYDNIPIFSWFILGGKCRSCKKPYSFRYALVEFITGVLFAALFLVYGWKWKLLEYLILAFGLVVISFIDLDHQIIPDEFSLGGIAIGLIGSLINPERDFWTAFAGFLMGGGFLWAIAYFYYAIRNEEGMGGGDIKLLAWLGAVLGWAAIPFIILVSSVIGSIVGLTLVSQGRGLKTTIPFGPYLAFAAILYMIGGHGLTKWYFSLFIPGIELP
jgi:leader peptidase (prepilin peptidase)/N-methyltransferase